MKEEKNHNAYTYISIVAIVAIVAVFVMFAGSGSKETQQPVVLSGDVVGDAIRNNNLRTGETLKIGDTTIERLNDGIRTTKKYQEKDEITGKLVNKQISTFFPDDKRKPVHTCDSSCVLDYCDLSGCDATSTGCTGCWCSMWGPNGDIGCSKCNCNKESTHQDSIGFLR